MAARDTYTKVHEKWEDQPSEKTPIKAAGLEHIEQGIKDAMDNRALREVYNDGSINLGRKAGTTTGLYSSVTGRDNESSANYSSANGRDNKVSGENSHAGGSNNTVSGKDSYAGGKNNIVSGDKSSVEGSYNEVYGFSSHGEGIGTITSGNAQHVQGKYNTEDIYSQYAHIVGGGTDYDDRKNIHTLDWQGNAVYAGDVKTGEGVSLNGIGTPETIDIDFSNYFT